MAKGKRILIAVLCALVAVSAVLGVGAGVCINSADSFRKSLTSLYAKYDDSALVSDSDFALKRIMIMDYDGEKFGAVDSAIDKKHSFAVLQYNNEADAKKAYDKALSMGYCVDADATFELNTYEKCKMHPIGSQAIGADGYLNNYKMGYDEVLVAVLDTGVMLNHPDLEGRFYNDGYDYSGDATKNAEYDRELKSNAFHSTFISGIIANNTPDNVKIVPYKVVPFGTNIESISGAISAIFHATDLGVDVINISFSSTAGKDAYEKAIKYATDRGVCVCVSAGNDSKEITQSYPAMVDQAITVSALNSTCERVATYSSFGDCVDFCAPGSKINSAVPLDKGKAGYESYSGTSFSTPYIASLCANIKSMNSKMSVDSVYSILRDFSVDFGDAGRDKYYGFGVPNLSNINYSTDEYSFKLPQGEIEFADSVNFEKGKAPWSFVEKQIKKVSFKDGVDSVGACQLYGLSNAEINLPSNVKSVGDYAFYDCKGINEITFDIDASSIGKNAFGETSADLIINGYSNSIVEDYAIQNDITFNSLGCRHSYSMEIIEPTDEQEGYTIYTCDACEYSFIGAYVEPTVVLDGQCGDNMSFELYNTGKLILNGSGKMYDYIEKSAPWFDSRADIRSLIIGDGISSISPFAFYECAGISTIKSDSNQLCVEDLSIYSADMKTLIMAKPSASYLMPEGVEGFNASAFVNCNSKIELNSSFEIVEGIVYNKNGDIIMAMPSYEDDCLAVDTNVRINDYAFILTQYPLSVRAHSIENEIGEYALGYSFNGEMQRDNIDFYGYSDTSIYTYCIENGFYISALNQGSCGENISWSFNAKTGELSLVGFGKMQDYRTSRGIPWFEYMYEIKSIIIDDRITSLSPYSFGGATGVKSITMPLSLNFNSNSNCWMACDNVESIRLTQGTGVMVNFTSSSANYTPWYKSRSRLKSLIISPDVKYIGSYAFKNSSVLKTLLLNDCDGIGEYAFVGCSSLMLIVNYSKQTEFAQRFLPNNSVQIYAFDDSSTRDYCDENAIEYASLGCEHSRELLASSSLPYCCFDTDVTYTCNDCETELYTEFVHADKRGHYIRSNVQTANGIAIENAEVYVNGELSAITNEYGRFVADGLMCGEDYSIEVKKHGVTLATASVNTNTANREGDIIVNYGDFNDDNVINVKDYAIALQNDFDDMQDLDFNMKNGFSADISTKYIKPDFPFISSIYNEENADVSYRRDFFAETSFGRDFKIVDYGFIYGKNMDDDFMTLENVGKITSQGYELKKVELAPRGEISKITYGSVSKTGKVSARIYIVYTNGVKSYTYYSDASSFEYE